MSIFTPRVVGLCIALFFASALITLSVKSPSQRPRWPSILHTSARLRAPANKPKVAFATFLAGSGKVEEVEEDDDADGYFLGARVLAYQLLHSPSARSNNSIPFLVLVTEDVSQRKRDRLTSDGAVVLAVDKLAADWVTPGAERWRDVLTKLRLFEMTQYAKICFIDADTLVTKPLDGVFFDKATMAHMTKDDAAAVKPDEAMLPSMYMFAGKPEAFTYDHPYPPAEGDYFNVGFFVFAPSTELFDYYMSLLALPGRFDPGFPEQNLLNYAHRRDGNMPWTDLHYSWNMNWPTVRDYEGGAASFHAKFWSNDPTHDPTLKAIWQKQRVEMEAFQRGRETGMRGD